MSRYATILTKSTALTYLEKRLYCLLALHGRTYVCLGMASYCIIHNTYVILPARSLRCFTLHESFSSISSINYSNIVQSS